MQWLAIALTVLWVTLAIVLLNDRRRRRARIRERLEWYTLHGWAEKNAKALAAREGTVNCERG